MTDLLTPDEVTARLRRTLAARAEVMAPGDGAAWDPATRAAPAALAPAARRPARRALVAVVAAAVVAAAGVAGAVALGGGGGEARVGPAGVPGDCLVPKTDPAPALGPPAARAPRVTAPAGCPPGAPATKPPDGGALRHGRPASFRIALAYVGTGRADDRDAWIDLVWLPNPRASAGTGGEQLTVDGHPARYHAATKAPGVRAVSVDYGDGLADLEAAGLTRGQLLAMAATLHRTGPATFAATPPAGWVPAPTTR